MRILRIVSIALLAASASAVFAQTNAPLAPGTARVIGVRTMSTYEESSSSYTDSNGKVQSSGSGGTRIRQVYKLETDKAFMEVTDMKTPSRRTADPLYRSETLFLTRSIKAWAVRQDSASRREETENQVARFSPCFRRGQA